MDEPQAAQNASSRPSLPDLYSVASVAELAEVSPSTLTYWAYIHPRRDRYNHFEIKKRSGETRRIDAPVAPLKAIQRSLASALTTSYKPPAHVHGFTRDRSPLTNARIHVGQRWLFAIDLANFFPSITYKRVRGLFRSWPFMYPEPVARLLAELCCYRNALPQGAPTSPIISNYLCRSMDRQIAQLAIKHRCYYSRYADDLVFSTDRTSFPTGIASFEEGRAEPSHALASIVKSSGFRINKKKTRMQICFERQRVTGLVVNEKANIPRSYLRGLRALIYIWERYGPQDAAQALQRAHPDFNRPPGKAYPGLAQVVRGRIQYVGSVRGWNDSAYLKLARRFEALDPHFEARTPTTARSAEAHLYTEGPTDLRHIRAALDHFHEQGEFLNLTLQVTAESDRGSDQKLAEYCRALKEVGTTDFAVCLFDTDTKIAREAVGSDGWRAYGPRVVAVGLAPPAAADQHGPYCIELLYEDSVLKTNDSEGRRVFKRSEFHPRTTVHESGQCTVPHAGKKSLIAEEVYEMGTNANVARSKAEFARAVAENPESFDHLSFEGFRPTFQRILFALDSLPR